MSTSGCTMFPGPHTFNHNRFMLWAAKAYRHACAREAGVGAGPIEMNLGEGWMLLEDISTANSFRMQIRRHPTNGEISFRLVSREGNGYKGLVRGKLEQNPKVSMILKRLATVVSAYMSENPDDHATGADVQLLGSGETVRDMRPNMSCAVEDIFLMDRPDCEVSMLLGFIESVIMG